MDINLTKTVNEFINEGKLDEAIKYLEEKMLDLPESDFNKLIGWNLLDNVEAIADYLDRFYNQAKKKLKKVGSIYCELNGFTINYDMWFVQFFAFKKFEGIDNLDWLADYDFEISGEAIAFGDIDDILQIFKNYMENEMWKDKTQEQAFEIGELIVILRVQQMYKHAHLIGFNKGYLWTKIPVLITAHDYDLIYSTIRI